MRIKDFGTFLNEKTVATVTAKATSAKKEESTTIPKKLADIIKQASEHNDKVQALMAELKAEEKTKELFDEAIKAKLKEAEKTSMRVGKILVVLKEKAGRVSYSYTDAINILRQKLFEVNQAAAKVCDQAIEALKKQNDAKVSVEYVKEGVVGDAINKIKAWFSGWKEKFSKAISGWTTSVDDLEESMLNLKESEQIDEAVYVKKASKEKLEAVKYTDLLREVLQAKKVWERNDVLDAFKAKLDTITKK